MRKRDLMRRQAIGVALAALAAGCTSDMSGGPAVSSIDAETYTVTLPPASDWVCEPVPANEEAGKGPGTVCGRELGDRTVIAAATEEFSAEVAAEHAGKPAAALLTLIGEAEAEERRARGDAVVAFSSLPAPEIAGRAGTACSGYRRETVDRQDNTRTVLRSLLCIDPRTRRPIRLSYFEEFPAATPQPRPVFEAEADEFFRTLRFL